MERSSAGTHARRWFAASILAFLATQTPLAQERFRVATYNVENYLLAAAGDRPAKSPAGRAKVRESIHAIRPDVIALQEIGGLSALHELQDSLRAEGLSLPHLEWVPGFDAHIQIAVLSRFPITGRRSHTNESFLMKGRRFQVSRGFAEIDIQVNPRYQFTLISAHLKSKRVSAEADEADLRDQEAQLLREKIDARLRKATNANLLVLGDFNDTKDSRPLERLIGRRTAIPLFDLRPAERNGDHQPNPLPYFEPRKITWTHHYGKEDTYSRIDFILASAGMRREWQPQGSYVLALANWGVGSDHRPVVAEFLAKDAP